MKDSFYCEMCPRRCRALRTPTEGQGVCGMPSAVYAARAALHYYEEPVISGLSEEAEAKRRTGKRVGSGTVFFSGCSLKCVFCQNYSISHGRFGALVTMSRLAEIFRELQDAGALNINLVNPTHYALQIADALRDYRSAPDHLPVVYNTGGYDRVETLRAMEGLIDIYLPDLKYVNDDLAMRYSGASDYFEVASAAIEEMYRQVGPPVTDPDGILLRGVVVRHLALPHDMGDTLDAVDYISSKYGDSVYLSVMAQYVPMGRASEFPEINRKISDFEYLRIRRYLEERGTGRMFFQERCSATEEMIRSLA